MDGNVKKIDVIVPLQDLARHSSYYSDALIDAFLHLDLQAKKLYPPSNKNNPTPFLKELMEDKPDCTLTFNGILPDEEGRCLSDLLHLPHLAYITESPLFYLSLCQSKLSVPLLVDQSFTSLFEQKGASFPHFLPLAARKEELLYKFDDKQIPYLMIPHWIDFNNILTRWQQELPPKLKSALLEQLDAVLTTPKLHFLKAFDEVTANFDTPHIEPLLLHEFERVLRAKDQLLLLEAFSDVSLHLLIPQGTKAAWSQVLQPMQGNFVFHEGQGFATILSKIKQSRVVLVSQPHIKMGSLEMPFEALMQGACVCTSHNIWLEKRYKPQEGVFYYTKENVQQTKLALQECVNNKRLFESITDKGRNLVCQNDTWEARAKELLLYLEEILPVLQTLPQKPLPI